MYLLFPEIPVIIICDTTRTPNLSTSYSAVNVGTKMLLRCAIPKNIRLFCIDFTHFIHFYLLVYIPQILA